MLDVKSAEPANFDIFAANERFAHRFENGVDGRFSLFLGDPFFGHQQIHQITFEHACPFCKSARECSVKTLNTARTLTIFDSSRAVDTPFGLDLHCRISCDVLRYEALPEAEDDGVAVTEILVDGAVLEGLFLRGVKPTGALRDALKELGYDNDKPEAKYPRSVLIECVSCARRLAYPGMSDAAAYRKLGAIFVDGYFSTILGRLTAASLAVVGPGAALKRAEKFWRRGDPGISIVSKEIGPKLWRLEYKNPIGPGDYVAGIIEAAGKRADASLTVSVESEMPLSGVLIATWT
jgi:uncharacterized protein (TIGR02265 family)